MQIVALGLIAVGTPGTAVRISSDAATRADRILIAVPTTNTGKAYVGTAGLVGSTKTAVIRDFTAPGAGPQDGLWLPVGKSTYQPYHLFVDAEITGEGLYVTLVRD
jgi:hypothetical protein